MDRHVGLIACRLDLPGARTIPPHGGVARCYSRRREECVAVIEGVAALRFLAEEQVACASGQGDRTAQRAIFELADSSAAHPDRHRTTGYVRSIACPDQL